MATTLVIAIVVSCASTSVALAHEERPVTFPDGSREVPTYRDAEPDLIVCKPDRAAFERRIADYDHRLRVRNLRLFERCLDEEGVGFRHLQDAVNAVDRPGANIAVLPGLYQEEPYRGEPTGKCTRLRAPESDLGYQVLSYAQQRKCPHNQNLVAILGKENLQIEGTGASRNDVVFDGGYRKLNVIRADRSHGIYFRNFTAQRSTFNSLYVLAADGFVIDDVLTRWNDEYGFLTFASDHGLYRNCESYGNGDSGIYPGSASNINDGRGYDVPRYSIEITGCRSHHNMVGYSGTAGDSVHVHGNEFDHNMGGAAMDSAFPGHPGLPQNHARFENNLIHDNNADYYRHVADGTCARPPAKRGYERGVVCPAISMPPGTGIITVGGNWNIFRDNEIYGHDRAAFYLTAVPAFIRGEDDLGKQFDTSHHNYYGSNRLGVDRDGDARPNAADVLWDGQGTGNCWQPDARVSSPRALPVCRGEPGEAIAGGSHRKLGEPVRLAQLWVCSDYSVIEARLPAGCDWYGASGIERVEVQVAIGAAVLLLLAGVPLWWRRLRTDRLGTTGLALGVVGLGADIAGATRGLMTGYLPALGLVLIGAWWLLTGLALRRTGRPGFGWFSLVLGMVALAEAVDKAIVLIPGIPVGPSWIRGALAIVWVLWAVIAAGRPPSGSRDDPPVDAPSPPAETPTGTTPADPRPSEPRPANREPDVGRPEAP